MVFLIASVAPAGLVTIGLLLAATCRRRGCACFIQQGKNKYMFRKGTAEIVPASGVPSPNRFLEDEIELHGNRLDDENEIELHGNRLDDEAAIAGEGSGVQLGHVGAGEHGADSPDRSSGDETESLIDSIKPSDGSPPQQKEAKAFALGHAMGAMHASSCSSPTARSPKHAREARVQGASRVPITAPSVTVDEVGDGQLC